MTTSVRPRRRVNDQGGSPPLFLTLTADEVVGNSKGPCWNWSPHCYGQGKILGRDAYKQVYVECASDGKNSQSEACKQEGVNAYLAWLTLPMGKSLEACKALGN